MSSKGVYERIPFENADFPIRINYGCTQRPVEGSVYYAPQWHEQMEILWFRRGGVKVYCSDTVYDADDGDIIIINPYELHMLRHSCGNPEYDCIMVDASLYSGVSGNSEGRYFEQLNKNETCFLGKISGDNEVLRFVSEICSEFYEKRIAYELSVRSALFGLLACLFRKYVRSDMTLRELAQNVDRYDRIKPALGYMKNNLSENIQLSTMAKLCSVNPSHFCRMFKKTTGKTPVQYLTEIRLGEAMAMLKSTDKSISQIACEVGIGDLGYFGRRFKEYFGITPSAAKDD